MYGVRKTLTSGEDRKTTSDICSHGPVKSHSTTVSKGPNCAVVILSLLCISDIMLHDMKWGFYIIMVTKNNCLGSLESGDPQQNGCGEANTYNPCSKHQQCCPCVRKANSHG